MFNQSFKKGYAKPARYTDLQTYFSEKNNWHSIHVFQGIVVSKFQGNRCVLSNVIVCYNGTFGTFVS